MSQKIADQYDILAKSSNFFGGSIESVSGQQLTQILPSSY
jgi:hypothetical protein